MKASFWIKILLLSSSGLYANYALAESNYYRYKDKDGQVVLSNSLPAEVANSGYEIVSPMGNIVETVLPRKSQEEIAADAKALEHQREAERQAEITKQQAAQQDHKDNILLKSFSSVADITRAKNDKLASIAVLENIVRENLGGLQKQLNDAKAAAATYSAKSQPIPASLQNTITESERQIKDGLAFLERKKAEKLEIEKKYQSLTEHYLRLQTVKTGSQNDGNTAPQALPDTTEQPPKKIE